MKNNLQALFMSPNVPVWMANLASHPVGGAWLETDPFRFAAFYAVLRGRIKMPESILAALPSGTDTGNLRTYEQNEEFEEWRKSSDRPVAGRASAAFLAAFWEGLKVATWAQHNAMAWHEALAQINREAMALASEQDVLTAELSGHARRVAEDSSLLSQPMSNETRDLTSLFRMNCSLLMIGEGFTLEELRLIEFAFVLAEDEAFRMFFELVAENPRIQNELMAAAFAMSTEQWEELVSKEGKLSKIHLVHFDPTTRRVLPLPPFWHEWLGSMHKSAQDAIYRLVRPMVRQRNAGAIGRLSPEDTSMVEKILASPIGMRGTNVLLYGPRSIDKTGWVADLLDRIDRKGWEIPYSVPENVRTSVCYMAQRMVRHLECSAVLVLSQADAILTRSQRGTRQFLFMTLEMEDETPDSPGEAALLLENPIPAIWLVNQAEKISENNIGRFLYTCEIKAASRAERKVEIEKILFPLNLSPNFINELSQHLRLGEEQLNSAVELVGRMFNGSRYFVGNDEGQSEREEIVRRAIEQSQKALDRRQRESLRIPNTTYSLEFLNTSGPFSTPQIIKSLRRHPNASLCFYGLPGTGKTQLGEYIAVELDKPILIKRASDILGKYVGENEKNIKLMFEEARDEDALLLLDEADSFLRDRTIARASWEVSTVNELLQGMERHRGVFICTTNLFSRLDEASLRRFTFKLEFRALNEEQRWNMFTNEARINAGSTDIASIAVWRARLAEMTLLTPGDFATVQRQAILLGEQLTPEQWLDGLAAEESVKKRQVFVDSEILGRGQGTQTL